ncbi:MAG: alpha/beta fold hydrolase [Gemmatimonadetes bacterium]|nr:alpha/beta fold hydrolase [Gemmatimonadota bacterium]
MRSLAISSDGARLNGIMYVANGPGPHPTVLLLHGDPGNERDLDIAQAVRRAGINVLFFNYRGSWGSGGLFTFSHVLGDVAAALGFVRGPEAQRSYRSDPRRVALVGHSMGGWAALMAAASDPEVACVGALDFVNAGAVGQRLKGGPNADSLYSVELAEYQGKTQPGAPYRAESPRAIVDEYRNNPERFDVNRFALSLSTRPLLLISAAFPQYQRSLADEFGKLPDVRLTSFAWRTDHSFSDRRIELARTVISWLKTDCRF